MRNPGKLSRLGLFEALEDRRMLATVTAELWSVPASVNPGQLSNVTVRVKYGNDGNDGPWQVKQLDLRESDPAFVYQNISERNNPFYINSQNAWHYYTFYNVNLGAYDDGGNGIELYVYAQVDDNDFNGFSPWDSSPVTNVAYNRPAPPTTPGNITASNVTANSATVSWGRSTDPNGDAISYEVDYKKDLSLFWTSAGTTTSTSRSLTGLEQDSVYDVRVRALDGTFESGWRDQENVITTTTTVTGLAFRSGPSTSSPILSSVRAGGAPVYVHVTAPGMTNGSVEVDVFEDDGIGDDDVGTLTVNVSNGTGYTTWNPVWQGDDADDPNNMYYLGHDCGLLVCETYSGASETGHLRVRTPLQNTINGQAQQIIDQEPVSLSRQDSSAAIDPTATTTWVLAHGWNTSDNEDNGGYLSLANLLDKVEEVRPDDQVLFINWSKPASGLLPVEPEGWIEPVAEWTSSIIDDLGFHPSSLNFIGHSFGSYVAHDTAEQLGGVNSLITIDPAEDPTTALINYNMSAADFEPKPTIPGHSTALTTAFTFRLETKEMRKHQRRQMKPSRF